MKPYRKHVWEYIPHWPSQYLPGQSLNMPSFSAYERCRDCCVTRTNETEDEWCSIPRDDNFEPFLYPKTYGYEEPGR